MQIWTGTPLTGTNTNFILLGADGGDGCTLTQSPLQKPNTLRERHLRGSQLSRQGEHKGQTEDLQKGLREFGYYQAGRELCIKKKKKKMSLPDRDEQRQQQTLEIKVEKEKRGRN